MHPEGNLSEAESLASALLKIRSDSNADMSRNAKPTPPPAPSQPPTPTKGAPASAFPPSPREMNLAGGKVRFGMNPSFSEAQLPQQISAPQLSAQQLAALQCVAAVTAGQYEAARSASILDLLHRQQAYVAAPPPQPVPLAVSPTPTSVSASSKSRISEPDHGNADYDHQVRVEHVEAALRSKPQRGRKRDNLNDEERLELTRTRNREHAKSTRVRKKARYEELVSNERKLHELEASIELEEKRRRSVMDFLAARERMLRVLTRASSSASSTSSSEETTTVSNGISPTQQLESTVEDMATLAYSDDSEVDSGSNALSRMSRFDERILSQVTRLFGTPTAFQLSYSVEGDMNGVALRRDHSALVVVELAVKGANAVSVSSALMNVKFSETSDKIFSVSWKTLGGVSDDAHVENLQGQVSHPSVVSLDPTTLEIRVDKDGAQNEEHKYRADGSKTTDDEGTGPGMSI